MDKKYFSVLSSLNFFGLCFPWRTKHLQKTKKVGWIVLFYLESFWYEFACKGLDSPQQLLSSEAGKELSSDTRAGSHQKVCKPCGEAGWRCQAVPYKEGRTLYFNLKSHQERWDRGHPAPWGRGGHGTAPCPSACPPRAVIGPAPSRSSNHRGGLRSRPRLVPPTDPRRGSTFPAVSMAAGAGVFWDVPETITGGCFPFRRRRG